MKIKTANTTDGYKFNKISTFNFSLFFCLWPSASAKCENAALVIHCPVILSCLVWLSTKDRKESSVAFQVLSLPCLPI